MSKIYLFLMILGLALSSVAFADADSAPASAESPEQYPVCTSVTACYSPYGGHYVIQCQTFGQGCQFWTVPGYSVQCTGFDYYGRWVNLAYRCY
ncbi:MAG: hypothetical protein H7301_06755 [Cryobacterium sp.]|nr:hypothetical protein [Oligoflexia bacterium]